MRANERSSDVARRALATVMSYKRNPRLARNELYVKFALGFALIVCWFIYGMLSQ